MMRFFVRVLAAFAVAGAQSALAANVLSNDIGGRIETIPIQTLTISDEQFLKGNSSGKPTTISGALRVARGSGRLPLVILVHGSGGIEENIAAWEKIFASMGISTFAIDSFTGRGIVSTVADQSQLGRLNMVLDLYRSLAVLAADPRIDPGRIAVMGFSRGGQATLYAARQTIPKNVEPKRDRSCGLYCVICALHHDLYRRYGGDRPPSPYLSRKIRRLGRNHSLPSLFCASQTDGQGCPDDRIRQCGARL